MLTMRRRWVTLIVFLGSMILTACAGEEKIVEVTRVVTEKETVVERVVETVVEEEPVVEAVVEPLSRPVEFIRLEGKGETVTEKYELPVCKKAVFFWTAKPDELRTASLHVDMHKVDVKEQTNLAATTESDAYDVIEGSALQPLEGGEYYFKIGDTDEPWTLRGECQDGQPPAGARIFIAGTGPIVTKNYGLPACAKSVFVWSIDPDDDGVASLVARLYRVGEEQYETLVDESRAAVVETIKGETSQSLSEGVYFIAVESVTGAWTLRWKCQD